MSVLRDIWNAICKFVETVVNGFCALFKTIVDFAKKIILSLLDLFEAIFSGIVQAIRSLRNKLVRVPVKTAPPDIKELIGEAIRDAKKNGDVEDVDIDDFMEEGNVMAKTDMEDNVEDLRYLTNTGGHSSIYDKFNNTNKGQIMTFSKH